MDTLTAYLSLRSSMGAEEGAALASALAERALCCGRGPVEAKADTAATVLLGGGGGGELARRGAWLVLAARAGALENEFFPPTAAVEEGGARKVAAAAAAPKAVSGCVRAMSAAMKEGAGFAGAGDSRKEVWCNDAVCRGGACVCARARSSCRCYGEPPFRPSHFLRR